MVIDTYVLLAYATIWTIFYWFLSQYISSLSRDKWIEYVRSFTYKPKLIRGSTNNYGWLDIVEYSEANILPGWLSGGWYEPGHEDNIPTSITPFICEEK